MNYEKRLSEMIESQKLVKEKAEFIDKTKGEVAAKFLGELEELFNEINKVTDKEYFKVRDFEYEEIRKSGYSRMLFVFWGNFSRYFKIRVNDEFIPQLCISNDAIYGEYVSGINNAVDEVLKFVGDHFKLGVNNDKTIKN